jgi:hypothetical protein
MSAVEDRSDDRAGIQPDQSSRRSASISRTGYARVRQDPDTMVGEIRDRDGGHGRRPR